VDYGAAGRAVDRPGAGVGWAAAWAGVDRQAVAAAVVVAAARAVEGWVVVDSQAVAADRQAARVARAAAVAS
jgi:hypothetical protein